MVMYEVEEREWKVFFIKYQGPYKNEELDTFLRGGWRDCQFNSVLALITNGGNHGILNFKLLPAKKSHGRACWHFL